MKPSLANVEGGKKRLLVAHILGQSGKDILAAREDVEVIEFPNTIDQQEFRALLAAQPAVHGVILGLTAFGRPELAAANGLQVVSRIGVGYDAVDIPAMSAAGIPVMICVGANCDTVAEHTLSSMLAVHPGHDLRRGELRYSRRAHAVVDARTRQARARTRRARTNEPLA